MPANKAIAASKDLQLLSDAAEEAGRLAMTYFRADPEVWMKQGNSPVSEADLAVNRLLRAELTAARPDYGWLSEEDIERSYRPRSSPTFVVDPIDGTRAFIEGKSTWCVSIAVVEEGRPVAGVLNCPAMNEVYLAVREGGAELNRRPVAVAEAGHSLHVAGPKYLLDRVPEELRRRIRTAVHIPSLAYRIAMVADGRLDATFVRPNAHDWDLAAADLIIEEAGGAILNEQGRQLQYCGQDHRHGEMVVGSGKLLDSLYDSIRAAAPRDAKHVGK